MSELRQDPITKKWVVIATNRAKRPAQFKELKSSGLHPKQACVFCQGKEHITGHEVHAIRKPGTKTDTPGWRIRVIKNKFASLTPGPLLGRRTKGIYTKTRGVGINEVIVMGDRNKYEAQMTPKQVGELIGVYRQRYNAHKDVPHINYILIFKNHRSRAGASIAHPHSQIYSLPVISDFVWDEYSGARKYHNAHKRCGYCDMVKSEIRSGKRIVFKNDDFVVFTPFASRSPFEMWVMPRKHNPNFELITDEHLEPAGEALHQALRRLNRALGNPAFNYFIHTAPATKGLRPFYHWHLKIIPRVTTRAGFELGTGIIVNTVTPEKAAAYLRKY